MIKQDVLGAMTQYRVEGKRSFCRESEDGKTTGQPRVIASGDHVARGPTWTAQEPQRHKAETETVNVRRHLAKACKPSTVITVATHSGRIG